MSLADKLKSFMQQKENDNLKAGEEFLAENGKRETVVTLPSGLQYEIIKQGAGEKPTAYNTVTCHYHGTTIKGEVFDSSVKRGQPASFPLNAVIKGWTEALQLMPVGSKWKLYIPPQLAYGNRTISREIGANSTLIFEVELISFK
jgi:FKBP-type peptidyl-prolyl cis-trans isomerase